MGRMTSCPSGYSISEFARFSATVLPVTVMQSPWRRPASRSIFMSGIVPPILTNSAMTYFPLGLRSASTGTRFPISVKSSMDNSTSAECAIARRCSTALVEPPRAITTVMAFSKALRVMISRGRIPFSNKWSTAAPASKLSRFLSSLIAAWAELLGRLMPRASMADAMVLAVYIPPQDPAPGMAVSSTSCNSSSEYSPLACLPTASNTDTISRSFSSPFKVAHPGRIVPP